VSFLLIPSPGIWLTSRVLEMGDVPGVEKTATGVISCSNPWHTWGVIL